MLPVLLIVALSVPSAFAVPVPGAEGGIDPLAIPKYVTPLVIPPEMPVAGEQPVVLDDAGNPVAVPAANYNIAVRQFKQQILPGGIWGDYGYPATTVWSYGPEEETFPDNYIAPAMLGTDGATFNYPAFTVEQISGTPTTVRWINDLRTPNGDGTYSYLPHLLPVDQTLHWANPAGPTEDGRCVDVTRDRDCASVNPLPYTGPVPIVTHVHGAHVNSESDGYPEAWFLTDAIIPDGYATTGTLYTQRNGDTVQQVQLRDAKGNPIGETPVDFDPVPGAAFYTYENSQPATTLWYHDHSLGMTRLNVYAGPAGFWLIRGGEFDKAVDSTGADAILPGPAARGNDDPNFISTTRMKIRDIPIAIQDRSFKGDGSLFYPDNRAFFDGFSGPFIGLDTTVDPPVADPKAQSDINPIWNPEAFFNTMVVNGTTWPKFEVAPATYRFRLLNGCNSRFLNLAMFEVDPNTNQVTPVELPFIQIGGDQGFIRRPVEIRTGFATPLPGDGTQPTILQPLPSPEQALLMSPAERMDVLVDFSAYKDKPGTIIRMINTAPDAPFGGFPDVPADPDTTGQVMQFIVNPLMGVPEDALTTSPYALQMKAEGAIAVAPSVERKLSLNEEESLQVCVQPQPDGTLLTVATFPDPNPNIAFDCARLKAIPQAPKAALLGLIGKDRLTPGKPQVGMPMLWHDPITELPVEGATEDWAFYNLTVDGHPIHIHLVRYQILSRQRFNPTSATLTTLGRPMPPLPNELGYKDTVLTYPGEITKVRATFDLPGLYVWHCHIVEHEDNEMMRPFYVSKDGKMPDNFPVP